MENMDSTVIATSLADDRARHRHRADRAQAGAHRLSGGARHLHSDLELDGRPLRRHATCSAGRSWCSCSARCAAPCRTRCCTFVGSRFLQGMGGAMMTPVARLVLVRVTPRNQLVDAMAWLSIPGLIGPIVGPPVGGFITTYRQLALDLPDQRADRAHRHRAGQQVPARLAPQRAAQDGLSPASSSPASPSPAGCSASRC